MALVIIPKCQRDYKNTHDSTKQLSVLFHVKVYVILGHDKNVFGIRHGKFLVIEGLSNQYIFFCYRSLIVTTSVKTTDVDRQHLACSHSSTSLQTIAGQNRTINMCTCGELFLPTFE